MARYPRLIAATALLVVPLLAVAASDWNAPPEVRDRKSPLALEDAAAIAAGKKVYEKRCLSCHGSQGRGDGRAAAYMQVKPEDLTREPVQVQTDGELFWKITTGRRPMPGFEDRLGESERWQAVAYLRQLGLLYGESTPAP